MSTLKLLVMDAYAPAGRTALRSAGGTEAGPLYQRVLERLRPGVEVDILHPADPLPDLPQGDELACFDGVVWTGSSLTIHDEDDPRVAVQIEFSKRVCEAGLPSFGSCWAVQLAVVAAGGRCAQNPKGREFGISRRIRLTEAGSAHPFHRDRAPVFDAFTSHQDEVADLPAQAALLASNDWSRVQSVVTREGRGRFWAVQYHPEYDLHEVASLCRLRRDELVAQGTFQSPGAADHYIEDLEALHADPTRTELAAKLEVGPDLLDEDLRTIEVRNWLSSLDDTVSSG